MFLEYTIEYEFSFDTKLEVLKKKKVMEDKKGRRATLSHISNLGLTSEKKIGGSHLVVGVIGGMLNKEFDTFELYTYDLRLVEKGEKIVEQQNCEKQFKKFDTPQIFKL